MHQILHFCNFFRGEPLTPLPTVKGHYCVSVTTTTSQPNLQPCRGNGVAVFLEASTGELLPTFYKGSSRRQT